jgi:hypothetical protein
MKRILLIAAFVTCIANVFAQEADSTNTNSKKKRISVSIDIDGDKDDSKKDSLKASKSLGFSFKLTVSRLDLGFVKLRDNGSFSLSPANSFLDYNAWKSNNIGFDVLEFGYRINSHFKIYLSGGFDWSHLRLENDITIQRNTPVLTYTTDAISYNKNRFSSSYLRIPLSFEFKSKVDKNGKKMILVFGPDAGFLINGRVKQKSSESGKQKFDDDYHFRQFRYGGFARLGYGGGGLYVKYSATDMFENSPAQNGLKTMSFGVTHAF